MYSGISDKGTDDVWKLHLMSRPGFKMLCGPSAGIMNWIFPRKDVNERLFEKSPYIAFYRAILKGGFQKYFDVRAFDRFFTKKISGLEPSVLQCLENSLTVLCGKKFPSREKES